MSTTPDRSSEARERLAEAVDAMSSTEGFQAWLRARALFHDYSLNNCMLIAMQRPDASRVAGYKAWQQLGRQVRKGERGIRILAPMVGKVEVETEHGTEKRARVFGFKCVSVFDVSQTDGDALPEVDYRHLEGEAPDLADHLCAIAMAAGLTISREAPHSPGASGELERATKTIRVSPDLSGAMAAKVVAHELGHYFDPWLAEHPHLYAQHRGDAEAVAESCAYVVCAAYGIDAGPSAVGYVTSWTLGNGERVRDLAERIDHAARLVLAQPERAAA